MVENMTYLEERFNRIRHDILRNVEKKQAPADIVLNSEYYDKGGFHVWYARDLKLDFENPTPVETFILEANELAKQRQRADGRGKKRKANTTIEEQPIQKSRRTTTKRYNNKSGSDDEKENNEEQDDEEIKEDDNRPKPKEKKKETAKKTAKKKSTSRTSK
jgi:hypothetical protein